MNDDTGKDDLVLHSQEIIDFISVGVKQGTGIMIHSFEMSQIRFAFAAYRTRFFYSLNLDSMPLSMSVLHTRKIPVQAAFDITKEVRGI